MKARKKRPWVLPLLVLIILVILFYPRGLQPYPRETIVIEGSTVSILSWNHRDNSVVLIKLPQDIAAEGTHGYGVYTLGALWKLGEIDKKDGAVLADSLSEVFGIPISYYIGPSQDEQPFSFAHILTFIRGKYRTNVSFMNFIRLTWLIQVTKPSRIDTYTFVRTPSLIAQDVTLADGSHQLRIDPSLVDARLAHIFEDEQVRRETLSTQVLNTTNIAALGTHAARLLTTVGVSVVSVGNDSPEIARCTVSGNQKSLESASAKVISSLLACKTIEVGEADRTDLTVRIGKTYAKRFIPN